MGEFGIVQAGVFREVQESFRVVSKRLPIDFKAFQRVSGGFRGFRWTSGAKRGFLEAQEKILGATRSFMWVSKCYRGVSSFRMFQRSSWGSQRDFKWVSEAFNKYLRGFNRTYRRAYIFRFGVVSRFQEVSSPL